MTVESLLVFGSECPGDGYDWVEGPIGCVSDVHRVRPGKPAPRSVAGVLASVWVRRDGWGAVSCVCGASLRSFGPVGGIAANLSLGPVNPAVPFVVGERGPEVLFPGEAGR